MIMDRYGIAVIGSIVHDLNKTIDRFPDRNGLVNCLSYESSMGGLTGNVARDLARLDPALKVYAVGAVGTDPAGDEMLDKFHVCANIDTRYIKRCGQTSFTDVLSEKDTKVRSFVYYAGANAAFDLDDVPEDLPCRMAHTGYILSLDKLDRPDPECGSCMAMLLRNLKQQGILTSFDVVSEASERYKVLIPPCLKYADLAFFNEVEAGRTVGTLLRDENGLLLEDAVRQALYAMRDMGAAGFVIIHAPEGAYALDCKADKVYFSKGLSLPEGFIAGTVGAGDAFASGCLLGVYRGVPPEEWLRWGIAAATASLRSETPSDAVPTIEEALQLL